MLYNFSYSRLGNTKNVTLRNMIIDRGEAEVDNLIPRGDSFYYRPLRNVMFILLYQIFSKELKTNRTRTLCCACDTVDSRYLEFEGTLRNTSRYPYVLRHIRFAELTKN